MLELPSGPYLTPHLGQSQRFTKYSAGFVQLRGINDTAKYYKAFCWGLISLAGLRLYPKWSFPSAG